MGESIALKVKKRDKQGSKALGAARKAGQVPGVLYGQGGEASLVAVDALSFSKVYKAAGQSSLLELSVDGAKPLNALIHEVQLDPLSNRFMHVDFYSVRMDEELETHVPLQFDGEAPAVREQGGILVKTLEEVLVKCLPKDLPHAIAVDIATLQTFDDQIHLSDLKLPKGVTLLGETETVVALVEAPRTDAQMAELDEKVEGDVTKVEGVEKEEAVPEAPAA